MKLKLGKLWNIPVELHGSWFIIFAIQTWILGTGYFRHEYPFLNPLSHWILGVFTSLCIFLSVLAHEFGHAWVAQRNHIHVRRVVLFVFGGIAEIEKEPESPGVEFWLALAGPAVNLVLTGLFALVWKLDAPMPILTAPSIYLISVNISLAVFNLLPGFPLDGGRILRAILWKLGGSPHRSTRIAGYIGKGIACLLACTGVLLVYFFHDWFDAFWLGFVAYFLFQAASEAIRQANQEISLAGFRVDQVIQRNPMYIPPETSLVSVVEDWFLPGPQPYYLVINQAGVLGLLTAEIIQQIPEKNRSLLNAAQAMKPINLEKSLPASWDAASGLRTLDAYQANYLPVIEEGRFLGVFSRQGVERFLQLHKQLGPS